MGNPAIVLDKVGVAFNTGRRAGSRSSFWPFGRAEKYWALKDVSLQVESGEIVGVVGLNGSGKTTLLRTIAGIYLPDEGSISVFEEVSTLLALGVGFKTNLSGLENIYLTGILMGYTKKQVQEYVDKIIEFAEIGDFIELPVRTYSTGMRAKLGFAISVYLNKGIMLIDEILSVGDARFRSKSKQKLLEIIQSRSSTVLIASHNTGFLAEISDSMIMLQSGRIIEAGEPEKVIEAYKAAAK